ncbi:YncE family protein [Calidifontibacillus erzurumensis]|uniref:PD40 domain-containing protein n=1 Tax=Calidifontibacillus erzurumensis TaxID=2741433 RepID=A0A8J8GFC7_9BACI|nr:PD40 domain-containing protein [Calidifontibacillus erzurumensis]NSL51408.1 PD40 domain-containing protein [Calidifontibacillus erzurumensis]
MNYSSTYFHLLKKFFLILVIASLLFLASGPFGKAESTKEMLYIGGLDVTFAVDPVTKKVTEIPIKGPNRDMTWTKDGRTLYINSEGRTKVAVVDTRENKVIDTLTFSTKDYVARIYGLAIDPTGEKLYATLMRSKVEKTELKALEPVIQVMDVKTKEVVKEIKVPWGTHTLQFFKDGKKLLVWAKDIYVYDIEKDELKLHTPVMNADPKDGIGNYLYFWVRGEDNHDVALATNYKFYPETGEVTEGVILFDLETGEYKEVEFNEMIGVFSGAMTKDRKTAYLGMNFIAKANLETGKYEKVVPNVPGTSYGFNLSGDGKTLYVSGAGPDISFYDAETLELKETIELSTDTMDVRVIQIQQ